MSSPLLKRRSLKGYVLALFDCYIMNWQNGPRGMCMSKQKNLKNILANDVPTTPSPKMGAWHSPTGSKKQNNRRKPSDLQRMLASASILIKNVIQGGFWLSHCHFCGILWRLGPDAELCSLWSLMADIPVLLALTYWCKNMWVIKLFSPTLDCIWTCWFGNEVLNNSVTKLWCH